MRRSPHLVSYLNVDDAIKKANRDTASETIRTLLVYGYLLEAPTGEQAEGTAAAEGDKQGMGHRTYRLEKPNAVTSGKWYFEMEVLTSGPMRIGWVEVSSQPGKELGSDDKSWAFDGFRVSISLFLPGTSLFTCRDTIGRRFEGLGPFVNEPEPEDR
uniref:SPRY domain-containing protein n=1 Tax=Scylla olivacea TaxID=85551 RepID=A0A0N7ZDQ6_SCYOL